MPRRKPSAPAEDLNLRNIVDRQFERAARHVKATRGLLDQIKACNAVYLVQFPVPVGKHRRTAAYVVAIRKVAKTYMELGIFP